MTRKYTTQEVNAAIKEYNEGIGETFTEDLLYNDTDVAPLITSLGEVKFVDSEPAMEGGKTNVWIVFSLNNDEYYQINGIHDSWDGTEWGSTVIPVAPQEIVTTIWNQEQ